jgi:hypothetical protein
VGDDEEERGGLGNNNDNYDRGARFNVVVERCGQRLGGKGGRGTTTTTTTMAGGEVASLPLLSTPIPAVERSPSMAVAPAQKQQSNSGDGGKAGREVVPRFGATERLVVAMDGD